MPRIQKYKLIKNKFMMKKITLFIFLLTASFGFAQNTVTLDVTDTWNAYLNFFDNPADTTPDCGGGFCFGSSWGFGDAVGAVGASSLTISPNVNTYNDNPGDAYWRNNEGAGPDGNKNVEANFYVEPGASFNGVDLTFTANVTGFTIDSRYTVVAFIKTIGGTNLNKTVTLTSTGVFSVSATGAELASGTVQFGFALIGINANPVTDWGNVVIEGVTLGIEDNEISAFNSYPNPTKDSWTIKSKNISMTSINVFDILGKNVLSMSPNSAEATINARNLKSGIYFAKVETPNGSSSVKLVKE